jgi:two-component system LytT family response regulator
MKLRAAIIDDEEDIRLMLVQLLRAYCPDVEIVAQAGAIPAALEGLRRAQPNLVLLDIQLADGTAFDLLRQLPAVDFKLIFVTAHDHYALRAFRSSALDYLLKPVDSGELRAAIAKARHVLDAEAQQVKLATLLHNLSQEAHRVILRTAESIHVVSVKDIIRCEAVSNYTDFFLQDKARILVTKTLREYEELLQPYGFFRLHQSHLVNLYHLKRYDKKDNAVVMCDHSTLPISPRKKEQLLELLKGL